MVLKIWPIWMRNHQKEEVPKFQRSKPELRKIVSETFRGYAELPRKEKELERVGEDGKRRREWLEEISQANESLGTVVEVDNSAVTTATNYTKHANHNYRHTPGKITNNHTFSRLIM